MNNGVFLRRCFFLRYNLSIRPFRLKGQLFDVSEQGSCARGRNGSRGCCKYAAHRNVGGKEDLEGPPQVGLQDHPLLEDSRMTEQYCIVYHYVTRKCGTYVPFEAEPSVHEYLLNVAIKSGTFAGPDIS